MRALRRRLTTLLDRIQHVRDIPNPYPEQEDLRVLVDMRGWQGAAEAEDFTPAYGRVCMVHCWHRVAAVEVIYPNPTAAIAGVDQLRAEGYAVTAGGWHARGDALRAILHACKRADEIRGTRRR